MAISPIIIFSIVTAILSFFCKIYLQDKLNGESSSLAILGVFRKIFGIKYVFPINKNNYPARQNRQVKTANLALGIFWFCFILGITLGVVEAFSGQK